MYRNILLENKKGKVGGYTLIQKRKRRKKFVNFIEEIVRLGKDNTSKMSIFEYSRFYLVLIFIQLIDCMVDFDQGIEYIFSSTYFQWICRKVSLPIPVIFFYRTYVYKVMCQFLLQLMIIFQEFGLYSAHLARFLILLTLSFW